MTASELKYQHEQAQPGSHFFDRDTMKFHKDTMTNFGVCAVGITESNGDIRRVWHLYRKRRKAGQREHVAFFDPQTFNRVWDKSGEEWR